LGAVLDGDVTRRLPAPGSFSVYHRCVLVPAAEPGNVVAFEGEVFPGSYDVIV
jgi:hypothetical protein